MNIFQRYGIKEVADVCLYSIELDENDDEVYVPVLYLDTLKVSTVEQTADQTSAQGGIGNPKLITWDYGKEIIVNLEDALFSPASQSMTWGEKQSTQKLKLYLRNLLDRETDKENPNANLRGAILNIDQFSDFLIIPDRWPAYELKDSEKMTGYVGGASIYCWLINGNIISNDQKKRIAIKELILFYREQTQKWYFFNGHGPTSNKETWYINNYSVDDLNRYGIGYQYGRDAFNWIKDNLSGNNINKWSRYLKDEWDDGLVPVDNDPYNTFGIVDYNKAREHSYRWTEYEDVAKATYEGWQDKYLSLSNQPEYNLMGGEVAFLTQELYIDGYKLNKCDKNRKYSQMSDAELEAAAIGLYSPYRYNVSLDIEYNTNITPPQEVIYKNNHDFSDVFYIDRIEKCFATQQFCIDTDINLKHGQYRYMEKYSETELTVYLNPKTMQPYEPNAYEYQRLNGQRITGNLRVLKPHEVYYKWTRTKAKENESLGKQIIIDASHFPGTYRLVGETYARDRITGEDQRYQFEIPLCKMGAKNNLILQADGEPTTFTMSLVALRRNDGVMMKLTAYDVVNKKYGDYISGSTEISPFNINVNPTYEQLEEANEIFVNDTIEKDTDISYSNLKIETPFNGYTYDVDTNPTERLTKANGSPQSSEEASYNGEIHVSIDCNTNKYTADELIRRDTINTDEPISIVSTYTNENIKETRYLNSNEYTVQLSEQE